MILDQLKFESLDDSNLFLRSLWASLRSKFDDVSWQYTPRRIGSEKKIRFGWVSLGGATLNPIEISIFYGRVGVIQAVQFELLNESPQTEISIKRTLSVCVEEAIKKRNNPSECFYSIQIEPFPNMIMSYYRGCKWYCGSLSNGNIELGVSIKGYDEPDRVQQFHTKIDSLISMLSCLTNINFIKVKASDGEPVFNSENMNEYIDNNEWLDDFPVEGGYLRISAVSLKFFDNFIRESSKYDEVDRSAKIFQQALLLYYGSPESYDVSLALLMSALESISLPSEKLSSCKECGQTQYKISQRVVDLGTKYLGSNVKKIFKDGYNRRSQYLHAGKSSASQPLVSKVIPQLDARGVEGCAMPKAVNNPKNLMEFTSFVIRRKIENEVDNI